MRKNGGGLDGLPGACMAPGSLLEPPVPWGRGGLSVSSLELAGGLWDSPESSWGLPGVHWQAPWRPFQRLPGVLFRGSLASFGRLPGVLLRRPY